MDGELIKSNIPKIIHYCWFGRGPKPKSALRYIEGWKRLMPDYQIIEWNEDNFDIHICPYVEQAYEAGKFAFVSDYARGHALYEMGGVYLDTDVEVLRPLDDLLKYRSFWGFETGGYIATSTIGTVPKHEMIKIYLEQYKDRYFINADGTFNQTTNVQVVTDLWEGQGLRLDGQQQIIGDNNIILSEVFLSPYDYQIGKIETGKETYAIHHYEKTWIGGWARVKGCCKKTIVNIFGTGVVLVMRKLLLRKKITSAGDRRSK